MYMYEVIFIFLDFFSKITCSKPSLMKNILSPAGTYMVTMGVFWLANFLLLLMEVTQRPKCLIKYKIQEGPVMEVYISTMTYPNTECCCCQENVHVFTVFYKYDIEIFLLHLRIFNIIFYLLYENFICIKVKTNSVQMNRIRE
jgi:hypothetical protein